MADEEKIDSYVDRASVADDTKYLTDQLKAVLDLFDKVNSTKVTLNGAKSMKDVVDAANQAKAAVADLATAKDKLTKTEAAGTKTSLADAKVKKELALASKAEAQARKENAAAALLEAKALQSEAKARKESADALLKGQQLADQDAKKKIAEQKAIEDLSNDYIQLSRAYTDAAKKAKNYALTLGEGHPVTVESVKDAKAMHDILLRVDQSVGQSQRNVGNYKSAFDGLGVSVTQVARELPSLAISVQQFVLAISNNLPMVADEIAKAKDEIAALKAEGKEAPSLFQRLGGAILSWQVGLSVGIALLTAYSGKIVEWVQGLFDSSVALKKAAEAQDILNTSRKEGIENEKQYQSLLNNDAEDIFARKQKEQLDLARARGASEKEILQLERDQLSTRLERAKLNFIPDQELFGRKFGGSEEQLRNLKTDLDKAKIAYQDFLRTGKAFGKELTKGGDDYQKADKLLKNSFDFQALLYEEQAAKVAEFYDAQAALSAKDAEISKNNAEQRAKFFAEELQYRADILKKLSELEEAQEITRVNARKEALKNEKAIAAGQFVDEIREAKNNQVKIFEANREYTFKRKKLQEDFERDVLAIHQTAIKQRREEELRDNEQFKVDQEEALNKQVDVIQEVQANRQLEDANGQRIEIAGLNKRYEEAITATKEGSRKRAKIERQYAEERSDIEYSYALAELKNQIDFAEQYIQIQKAAGKNVTANETELHKLRMQLSDLETKHVIENNKRQAKTNQEKFEEVKRGLDTFRNVYSETTNFIGGLLSASIDKQKNAIADQIDDIEKKKEKEIEAINASSQSQQDKAAAIALVEAKAAAQREALERKQRQLEQQKARFEKAVTIGRIIADTAAAVVAALGAKPWTPANIATAIAVGAIGAGQLAVAAATPIPKFKDGREGGPATWAITGDGGKNEVVVSPDLKQAFITPATDTLTYLDKDWKVFPDVKAFQEAAMSMVHKPLPALPIIHNNNDGLIRAMAYEIGGLKRAILGKQETYFHWDNGELHKSIKKGNDWWRYIQNNI
jgi:hypothetical protein